MVNMEKKKINKLCCQDYEEYCEQVYGIGRNMINLIKEYGERLDDFLEKNINRQNSDSLNNSFSTSQEICRNRPETNHENIINELNKIQNQLDTATQEESVSSIQFLSKSLDIVIIDKRVPKVPDKAWNEYCNETWELGRLMIKIIKCYGDRLKKFI